jgi:hypothetical protein
LAILAKISTAFENAIPNACIFSWLEQLKMAGPAALRSLAALAGPGQAILAYP